MKILCVDDDSLVRVVTCDLLRELGHDVLEASGGTEALSRIRKCGTAIDMLITDIQMPDGFDGHRIVELARKELPNLPVIYFTAYVELEQGDDMRTKLLRKPCSLGSLEKAISSLSSRNGSGWREETGKA